MMMHAGLEQRGPAQDSDRRHVVVAGQPPGGPRMVIRWLLLVVLSLGVALWCLVAVLDSWSGDGSSRDVWTVIRTDLSPQVPQLMTAQLGLAALAFAGAQFQPRRWLPRPETGEDPSSWVSEARWVAGQEDRLFTLFSGIVLVSAVITVAVLASAWSDPTLGTAVLGVVVVGTHLVVAALPFMVRNTGAAVVGRYWKDWAQTVWLVRFWPEDMQHASGRTAVATGPAGTSVVSRHWRTWWMPESMVAAAGACAVVARVAHGHPLVRVPALVLALVVISLGAALFSGMLRWSGDRSFMAVTWLLWPMPVMICLAGVFSVIGQSRLGTQGKDVAAVTALGCALILSIPLAAVASGWRRVWSRPGFRGLVARSCRLAVAEHTRSRVACPEQGRRALEEAVIAEAEAWHAGPVLRRRARGGGARRTTERRARGALTWDRKDLFKAVSEAVSLSQWPAEPERRSGSDHVPWVRTVRDRLRSCSHHERRGHPRGQKETS